MSDIKNKTLQVSDYYSNLHELNGAVLDKASYEKHKAESPSLLNEAVQNEVPQENSSVDDVFAAPQDFRQIAARQIETDRRAEYRPETAAFVLPQYTGDISIETTETHFMLGEPHIVCTGSGSYLSSGSYGSYITSGSYVTSGSYQMTSGSFSTSGSCLTPADTPYMGSFDWGFAAGGYGLDLI